MRLHAEQLLTACLTHPTICLQQHELLDHPVTQKTIKQNVQNESFFFSRERNKEYKKEKKHNTFARCLASAPVKITTPSRTKSYFSSSDA